MLRLLLFSSLSAAGPKDLLPDQAPAPADGPRCRALVWGNEAYEAHIRLDSPARDAAALATALEGLGCTVTREVDRSLAEMTTDLAELRAASAPIDTVVVYYSGHGLEVDGRNYLLPVDFKVKLNEVEERRRSGTLDAYLRGRSIAVAEVAAQLPPEGAGVLLVDACRNFALTGAKAAFADGLAPESGPSGTVVAYATSAGSLAADGAPGALSPWAAALAAELAVPGRALDEVLIAARVRVLQATRHAQEPEEHSRLTRRVVLGTERGLAPAGRFSASGPAIYDLALDHFHGRRGRAQDPVTAATLAGGACDLGVVDACVLFGHLLDEGPVAVRSDKGTVARLYRHACEAGSTWGCHNLGWALWRGYALPAPDVPAALAAYERGCGPAYPSGCRHWGYRLRDGLVAANGTVLAASDAAGAAAAFGRGCELGDAVSCTLFGYVHDHGQGVARDDAAAVRLYLQACDLGDGLGCRNAAVLVEAGGGEPSPAHDAARLRRRACELDPQLGGCAGP